MSAPINVPSTPEAYAITDGTLEGKMQVINAAVNGGAKAGVTIPKPFTSLATRCVTNTTTILRRA